MVLAEMGCRIIGALQQLNNAIIIDEKVLTDCLNEISRALMSADVQFKMIGTMQLNIKKIVNLNGCATGHNKRKIIHQAVVNELCNMLDPGKPTFTPQKGKPHVIMFVGLQGSGKTTTCTKYAFHYQKKGWKPALVCADTFRAGAFDQLKQNATKARIPFYGSYTETDPVKVAQEGVERFRKEKCDLIIVDTSGRHKQEETLFEEMRQLAGVTNPDLVIFVMDSSIGQATFDQAQAFKQSVAVGAVIITKMDGHAKGGGALSAVAATKSPIIFLGTGERMDQFEAFEAKAFVSRLLGEGDWRGFIGKIHEAIPMDQQQELMQNLEDKNLSLRTMYVMYQKMLEMDSYGDMMSMIPGLNQFKEKMLEGSEKEHHKRIRKFMVMMDSMTNEELDSTNPKLMINSRINRIARGSGHSLREVYEMLEEYKLIAKGSLSLKKGLKISKKGDMSAMSQNINVAQMSKVLPPQILGKFGGVSGLQRFMKNFNGKDFPRMSGDSQM